MSHANNKEPYFLSCTISLGKKAKCLLECLLATEANIGAVLNLTCFSGLALQGQGL